MDTPKIKDIGSKLVDKLKSIADVYAVVVPEGKDWPYIVYTNTNRLITQDNYDFYQCVMAYDITYVSRDRSSGIGKINQIIQKLYELKNVSVGDEVINDVNISGGSEQYDDSAQAFINSVIVEFTIE